MSNAPKEPSNRFWWLVIVSCTMQVIVGCIQDKAIFTVIFITYLLFLVIVVRREFSENRLGSFFGYKPKTDVNSTTEPPDSPSDSNQ